jgi:hypothetical protein
VRPLERRPGEERHLAQRVSLQGDDVTVTDKQGSFAEGSKTASCCGKVKSEASA